MKTSTKKIPFRGLSIQQRLPLLICILLLSIVIALGALSYYGVKKATFEIGKERLVIITEQLSSMFGQSALSITTATRAAASDQHIKKFLSINSTGSDSAQKVLDKLRYDSTWLLVQLLDSNQQTILSSASPGTAININTSEAVLSLSLGPDSCKLGKFYHVGSLMYYPIIASVTENQQVIGYLVRWRLQTSTAKGLAQFSQLLGTNARLYIGNRDGSLWTDLIQPIPSPPVDIKMEYQFFQYERSGDGPVISSVAPVANTQWVILIELSQKIILETSKRFLGWVISIGTVLVIIGSLLAWIMSRNMTRPLNKLTAATTAMAEGDYTVSVEGGRSDELGKLASAFNTMAIKIMGSQKDLETKVKERTAQLEMANKELEAFSYSVSHDLRAPLRSISGYSRILKDDYASSLDEEANRITDKIISNARKMGELIDDLISFSQMARKEIRHLPIDMTELARSSMDELLQLEPENKYRVIIHPLPECLGDKALIKQVWINLISNALKYSSKVAAPSIEIGCRENGTDPLYFIRDNGDGFDMQYAHKLFGVFQRLHSQKEFEGSGVGLALVKRIITRHNGDIQAEASPGKGAEFYFSLPNNK